MASMLHRVIVAFSALAFLSGIAAQTPGALGAVSGTMPMSDHEMGCAGMNQAPAKAGDDMDRMPARIGAHQKAPAKGTVPNCMKSGCACPANLPARTTVPMPTARPAVAYWPPELPRAGLSLAPDPFPPIAA